MKSPKEAHRRAMSRHRTSLTVVLIKRERLRREKDERRRRDERREAGRAPPAPAPTLKGSSSRTVGGDVESCW